MNIRKYSTLILVRAHTHTVHSISRRESSTVQGNVWTGVRSTLDDDVDGGDDRADHFGRLVAEVLGPHRVHAHALEREAHDRYVERRPIQYSTHTVHIRNPRAHT